MKGFNLQNIISKFPDDTTVIMDKLNHNTKSLITDTFIGYLTISKEVSIFILDKKNKLREIKISSKTEEGFEYIEGNHFKFDSMLDKKDRIVAIFEYEKQHMLSGNETIETRILYTPEHPISLKNIEFYFFRSR